MALKHRRTLLIRLTISAILLILILLTAPYLNAQEETLTHAETPAAASPTGPSNLSPLLSPNGE